MNPINFVFFEEFKKLEKLCNDIYATHNGVIRYIDDMKTVSYSEFHNIPNWGTDLNTLKRLRHIRNNLAHTEGAFEENICTQSDVEWVQVFHKRILNQTDPLAMLHQDLKVNVTTITATPKDNSNHYMFDQKNTKGDTFLSAVIIILTIILLMIIAAAAVIFTAFVFK